ncbi:MAG: GNAT family N-acetyltransferase [Clostridia bacterium]|nr:GNAT family N-acetyltransferase [Clostridia bacterium]
MIIRQLNVGDTQDFCNLIVDMYSNIQNLEWFSPMPYDFDNVKSMIENPRFFIIGIFIDNKLCAVSSFDFKCGKLIGKIEFPTNCNTDRLVEIGFTMVHSDFKGQGLMKKMVEYLLTKAKQDGFEWVFSKVHKDNFASSKSLIYNNFYVFNSYKKPVKKDEFISLSQKEFFSKIGKENAKKTLSKFKNENEIIVDYNILIKNLT